MSDWPRHLNTLFPPETSSSSTASPSSEGTNGVKQRFPDLARILLSRSPQGIQQSRRQTVNSNLGLAALAIHALLGVRVRPYFILLHSRYTIGADNLFRQSLRRQQLRELRHGLLREGWTMTMIFTHPSYLPYPSLLCLFSPSIRSVGIVGSL